MLMGLCGVYLFLGGGFVMGALALNAAGCERASVGVSVAPLLLRVFAFAGSRTW